MSNEQDEIREAMSGATGKNPAADGGDAALGTAGNIEEIAAPGRKHYPSLDGLRGIAVVMVLLFHYSPLLPVFTRPLLGQGWAGVQLFFVLSGFLITGILYDSKGQLHYFRNFYARRTLRIFPLYYGVLSLLLVSLLALRFGFPHIWAHKHLAPLLWSYQPWLWTYAANVQMAVQGSGMFLFGHFWTLCVEEQFYLIWPLAVFACGRRSLSHLCLLAVAGALVTRLALSEFGTDASTALLLTPCQMDSLAAGALVAMLIRGGADPRRLCRRASVIAAISATAWLLTALLIPSLWQISRSAANWMHDFLYSVLAALFASLLLLAITPGSTGGIPGRVLNWRVLRWLGGYSYGIYVFHFPIWIASGIFLQDHGLWTKVRAGAGLGLSLVAVNATVSIGLAFASFHLYEKRFLKLKKNFPERVAATSIATDH